MKVLKNRCFYNYLYVLLYIFISSCAQQLTPGGGPVDKKSPEVKESSPPVNSKNFSADKVKIQFNEYVLLKDLSSNLLVSPPMKILPEVLIQNKQVIIKREEALKPNTTYVVSFGNSITDITEGNAVENF